jgi:hypothetical protein
MTKAKKPTTRSFLLKLTVPNSQLPKDATPEELKAHVEKLAADHFASKAVGKSKVTGTKIQYYAEPDTGD